MNKKLLSLLLAVVLILSLTGCDKKENTMDLTDAEQSVALKKTMDIFIKSLDIKNNEILQTFQTFSSLYETQNNPKEISNNQYNAILTDTGYETVPWSSSFASGDLNSKNFLQFKLQVANKDAYSPNDFLGVYLCEKLYNLIDFEPYHLILEKGTKDEGIGLEEQKDQWLDTIKSNEENLEIIDDNGLFSLKVGEELTSKEAKKLKEQLNEFSNLYSVYSSNYKLKIEMDKLKEEILATSDYSPEFIKGILDKTTDLMTKYNLTLESDLSALDDLVSLTDYYFSNLPFNPIGTISKFAKEFGKAADKETNRRLGVQFTLAYILNDDISFNGSITLMDLVRDVDGPYYNFVASMVDNFPYDKALLGAIGSASDEHLQLIFDLAEQLNNNF